MKIRERKTGAVITVGPELAEKMKKSGLWEDVTKPKRRGRPPKQGAETEE